MINYMTSNGLTVFNNIVILADGTKLPPCPSSGHNSTVINGKVYIDGYEFKNGKWRKTMRALWYRLF